MNTTDIGRLGEAAVISELTKQGWYPFVDISGKCAIDLTAWKDGELKSIQVKTTTTTNAPFSWTVQIRSVRPNRTANVIKGLSNNFDTLAVCVAKLNRICFIPREEILTSSVIILREEVGKESTFFIDDYETL